MKSKTNAIEPSHYTDCAIQPLDYICANNLNFLEGNVVKYVTRHKAKNGKEDLEKALYYLQRLIDREYGVNPD